MSLYYEGIFVLCDACVEIPSRAVPLMHNNKYFAHLDAVAVQMITTHTVGYHHDSLMTSTNFMYMYVCTLNHSQCVELGLICTGLN